MCLVLRKWLAKNRLTPFSFARKYKISQPFLSQILNGRRRAGRSTVKYICDITGGEVTERDLRPDWFEDAAE